MERVPGFNILQTLSERPKVLKESLPIRRKFLPKTKWKAFTIYMLNLLLAGDISVGMDLSTIVHMNIFAYFKNIEMNESSSVVGI